jgi:hypothetical protein
MTPTDPTLARKLAFVTACKVVEERSGLSPADLADCYITLRGDTEELDCPAFAKRKMNAQ